MLFGIKAAALASIWNGMIGGTMTAAVVGAVICHLLNSN